MEPVTSGKLSPRRNSTASGAIFQEITDETETPDEAHRQAQGKEGLLMDWISEQISMTAPRWLWACVAINVVSSILRSVGGIVGLLL